MDGNELIEINNLFRSRFKEFNRLAISMNQLSCGFLEIFLSQVKREWPKLTLIAPWQQKHGQNCTGKYRQMNVEYGGVDGANSSELDDEIATEVTEKGINVDFGQTHGNSRNLTALPSLETVTNKTALVKLTIRDISKRSTKMVARQ